MTAACNASPMDASFTRQPAPWLALEAGEGRYLVPPAQAGEIFPWCTVQPTPYARPWFLGVANLRGNLCGVVDLAAFLGGDGVRCERGVAESRLLGLPATVAAQCALRIDRLHGLRGADAFVQEEAGTADAPAWFGSRQTDAEGRSWQVLDLQQLARSPQFLSIDA